MANETKDRISELLADQPEHIQHIIVEIIKAERVKIHMGTPRGLADEIVSIIEKAVK